MRLAHLVKQWYWTWKCFHYGDGGPRKKYGDDDYGADDATSDVFDDDEEEEEEEEEDGDDSVPWDVTELDWQLDDTAKGQEWPSRDLKRTFFNQEFLDNICIDRQSFGVYFVLLKYCNFHETV